MPNPDGTVQVAPPTQSAFGPASRSDPPPPAQPAPAAAPQQSEFAQALVTLLKSLASFAAPKFITKPNVPVDNAVQQATQPGLADDLTR